MLPKRLRYYQCYDSTKVSYIDKIKYGSCGAAIFAKQNQKSKSSIKTEKAVAAGVSGFANFAAMMFATSDPKTSLTVASGPLFTGLVNAFTNDPVANAFASGFTNIFSTYAIAEYTQWTALDTALADAEARVTSCDTEINGLCSQVLQNYGIQVDPTTGTYDQTISINDQVSEIDRQINELQKEYGTQGTDGQQGTALTEENQKAVQDYTTAYNKYTKLSQAVSTVESCEQQISSFDAGKDSYTGKELIVISKESFTATVNSFTESDFNNVSKNKDGSVNSELAQQRASAAKQQAQAKLDQFNQIAQKRTNELAKGENANNLESLKSQLNTAEDEMNTARDKQLTKSDDSNGTATGMTVAQYKEKMNELQAKKAKLSDKNAQSGFNSAIAKIQTKIEERNTAQALLKAHKTVETAQANKDASAKGPSRDAAEADLAAATAQQNAELQAYNAKFAKQNA